jgi:hypothetical protein
MLLRVSAPPHAAASCASAAPPPRNGHVAGKGDFMAIERISTNFAGDQSNGSAFGAEMSSNGR